MKDLNATQAAIRAGYARNSAKVTASRLLSDANVQAEIQKLNNRLAAKNEITAERTMQEIARLAYGDRRKLWDESGRLRLPHELDEDTAALLSSIETEELYEGRGADREAVGLVRKVKTWDKGRALEQCLSILGMHKTAVPPDSGALNLTIRLSGKGEK